jgi:dynein heavy chain 2
MLLRTGQLKAWMADLLPRSIDWALARPRPAEPTRAGLLASAFSHLAPGGGGSGDGGVRSKGEAAAALARGLGAHMAPATRREFATELARCA